MPTLKLTYFDSPGRAEPLRVAMHMGNLAFEDKRLNFQSFAVAKARGEYPLGSVPVLEIDGVPFVQTAALLRYVARIGDASLYPTDPAAALAVDSALDSLNDTLSNAMLPSLFERDPVRKLAMRAELAAGPLARVFSYVESLIERSGGPYIAGATMSIADIAAAQQILSIRSGRLDGLTETLLEAYPRLSALTDAYSADPRVVAYNAR